MASNAMKNKQTKTITHDNSPMLRLFLVEDSSFIRDFIIENVNGINGISVVGSSDTENEALETLRKQACDVLILDIELKQGNGISLLRNLDRDSVLPNMLKIVFSNHVSGTYQRVGEQYGVQYFFDKAAGFSELRTLLEQLGTGAAKISN